MRMLHIRSVIVPIHSSFEYQGEDPFLAYHMAYTETLGIQSQNVSGCVKHFVFNNEEDDRSGMSSNVNDRPAKELYYQAFQGSVDAGVGSAMCSYVIDKQRRGFKGSTLWSTCSRSCR